MNQFEYNSLSMNFVIKIEQMIKKIEDESLFYVNIRDIIKNRLDNIKHLIIDVLKLMNYKKPVMKKKEMKKWD